MARSSDPIKGDILMFPPETPSHPEKPERRRIEPIPTPYEIAGTVVFMIIIVGSLLGGAWLYLTSDNKPRTLTNEQIAAIPTPRESYAPASNSASNNYAAPTIESKNALFDSDRYITNIENSPAEYQLAFIDSGHSLRYNDINAARIRYLLKAISKRTGDSRAHIADRTSRSTVVLRQDGKAVTNERFLEEANNYFTAGGPKISFNDLSTALIITLER